MAMRSMKWVLVMVGVALLLGTVPAMAQGDADSHGKGAWKISVAVDLANISTDSDYGGSSDDVTNLTAQPHVRPG